MVLRLSRFGSGFRERVDRVRVFWSAQRGGAYRGPKVFKSIHMVGKDPAPFGAGTSEPHVTLDTSHHAGGLRPIESMAAAQMQQLETNALQRRPDQQPSAAAAANVFTTAQHAVYRPGCRARSPDLARCVRLSQVHASAATPWTGRLLD